MSQEKVSRRKYIYYAGAVVVVAAVAGGAYYATQPTPTTPTPTTPTPTTPTPTTPTPTTPTPTTPGAYKIPDFGGDTLSITWPNNPEEQYSRKFLPEWESSRNAKTRITEFPEHPDQRIKELMAMTAHTGEYDVLAYDDIWCQEFTRAGYLEDFGPYMRNETKYGTTYDEAGMDWNDVTYKQVSGNCVSIFDEKLYGFPYSCGTTAAGYNKRRFEAAGIDHEPKTAEEVVEFTKMMTDVGKKQYGISMFLKKGSFGSYWMAGVSNGAFGGRWMKPDFHCGLSEKEAVSGIQWSKDMIPYAPPGCVNFDISEAIQAFINASVGISIMYMVYHTTMWGTPQVKKEDVGYFLMPASEKAPSWVTKLYSGLWGNWSVGVSVDSKRKQMAYDFCQWHNNKDVHTRWCEAGGPPNRHSEWMNDKILQYQGYPPLYEYFTSPIANPCTRVKLPEWESLSEIGGTWGNAAWAGIETPQKAMDNAVRDSDSVMTMAGYYKEGAVAYYTPKVSIAVSQDDLKWFNKPNDYWVWRTNNNYVGTKPEVLDYVNKWIATHK